MGQGCTAYESYVRIHDEMGCAPLPTWQTLPHVRRMAWEAAAQAVARSILPEAFGADSADDDPASDEGIEDHHEGDDDEGLDID